MENENKETQETTNEVSTPEDLEVIKAQLEEEQAAFAEAKTAAEVAMAEKDARIAELLAEGVAISEANALAVAKYLGAVRLANPTIPQDIIAGNTIEEIDASLEKALSIASAVKASLEDQAQKVRIPVGAPTRGEISLEGLSPREKIAAGLTQKGGM
jgi:predicted ATP-dependent Lon-type protease